MLKINWNTFGDLVETHNYINYCLIIKIPIWNNAMSEKLKVILSFLPKKMTIRLKSA